MSGDSYRGKRLLDEILDVPVAFGLRAQGKFEHVRDMRADGASWEEIAEEIGWTPEAAERFYEVEKT